MEAEWIKRGLWCGDEGLLLTDIAFRMTVVQMQSYAQVSNQGHTLLYTLGAGVAVWQLVSGQTKQSYS